MQSCLYEGTAAHRRREPVTHEFQYRLYMAYLDLDELASLVGQGSLIASTKYAIRSFLRSDHLFDDSQPLEAEIRKLILAQTGRAASGPIRMLTQLRYFGCYFSPLNVFYVFDQEDRRVEYVVAEVSNTPWNERHCYVLWDGNRFGSPCEMRFAHPKNFHVSPFMGMEMEYRWRLTHPGTRLDVGLENKRGSQTIFDARMTMQRRELNTAQLRRMSYRYPFMTGQIVAAIYHQAGRLWWKKCPFYPHPKTLDNRLAASQAEAKSSPPKATATDRQAHRGCG